MSRIRAGFTLLETLVVMGILALLIGMTALVETNSLKLQVAEQTAELMRVELVSARNEAISNSHDGPWGVYVENNSIVQFHGDAYSSRDQTFDKRFDFDGDVSVSGTREYIFQPSSGLPSATGMIDFSSTLSSYSVTLNRYGSVEVIKF